MESYEPQAGAPDGTRPVLPQTDEWQRIEQAYQEIQRRDESAERRA
jgi:hypothetical protein